MRCCRTDPSEPNGFSNMKEGGGPCAPGGSHAHSSILSRMGRPLCGGRKGRTGWLHYRWDETSQDRFPVETCPETYVGPGPAICVFHRMEGTCTWCRLKGSVFCYQYNSEDGHLCQKARPCQLPTRDSILQPTSICHPMGDICMSRSGARISSACFRWTGDRTSGNMQVPAVRGKEPQEFLPFTLRAVYRGSEPGFR